MHPLNGFTPYIQPEVQLIVITLQVAHLLCSLATCSPIAPAPAPVTALWFAYVSSSVQKSEELCESGAAPYCDASCAVVSLAALVLHGQTELYPDCVRFSR